jgi:hydroxyacylglutathione hydrolase
MDGMIIRGMDVFAVPAFSDNYIWFLCDGARATVVDPGDAAPVTRTLHERGLELAAIVITHHHPDHTGGLAALRAQFDVPAFGPATESIGSLTHPLADGARVEFAGASFDALLTPGHTRGQIAYFGAGLVLTGDTLFSAGCGRLFEGTPAQMHDSLMRLAALPHDTRVLCGHEYTLANLAFAAAVEPDNDDVARRAGQCRELRTRGEPTLPSTIGLERRINPFLRCAEPAVIAAARAHGATADDPVSVFAAIRRWKDGFRAT